MLKRINKRKSEHFFFGLPNYFKNTKITKYNILKNKIYLRLCFNWIHKISTILIIFGRKGTCFKLYVGEWSPTPSSRLLRRTFLGSDKTAIIFTFETSRPIMLTITFNVLHTIYLIFKPSLNLKKFDCY